MDLQLKDEIRKANFYPSQLSTQFDELLRRKLGFSAKYEVARLALGRSLAEGGVPSPLSPDDRYKSPIRGELLFGSDWLDFWLSLFISESGVTSVWSLDAFRQTVEAHWSRGLQLLEDDWNASEGNYIRFIQRIASLLPASHSESVAGFGAIPQATEHVAIQLKIGPISKSHRTGEVVTSDINSAGASPHIALMGKVGSGKTQTGMNMALSIVTEAQIPFLLIDPKGDFSGSRNESEFRRRGIEFATLEVGSSPIPLDFLPKPNSGNVTIRSCAMQLRDSILLCCKSPGDLQADMLRDAIESVAARSGIRSLAAVRDCYVEKLSEKGSKTHDSIVSRLNEMLSLPCFTPTYNAAEFFAKSWILDLRLLPGDELKRLVMLLILDALRNYILSQNDSLVGRSGHRSLRHLLIIDEARRVLAERKYSSLVDILRQGRSKGSVTMLISQDPSDFDGQADDFTTQLGTVIAFKCAQSTKGLRSLQGAYGRKLQPAEFSDTHLPSGVAFCKLPEREPERIICWEPSSFLND